VTTAVEICNLALGHLGQDANVSSIDPPEFSFEGELCARFYPLARDVVLESADWTFAIRTVDGAPVPCDNPAWSYAYALPDDCLRLVRLRAPGFMVSATQPQEDHAEAYSIELGTGAVPRVYAHAAQAVLRYVSRVADAIAFPPLFVQALTWKLAAMLAGPIYKGDVGRDEAKRCEQMLALYIGRAVSSDVGQGTVRWRRDPPWVTGR